MIEGLSIDFTDLKYLPREECQKPDTKIWKIAMWGGMNDWNLLNKLWENNETFETYLKKNSFEYGSGLHPKENETNKVLIEGQHIDTSKIKRYYNHKENSKYISKEFRNNNLKLFEKPLAIIKEGITNKGIVSGFFDYDIYYNKAVYGFASPDKEKTKSISIIFNSDLAKYYFFLTSSSWGIERDRIVLTEYLKFPYLELLESENIQFEKTNFEESVNLINQENQHFDKNVWEKKIAELYQLSKDNLVLINDTLELSIDLFYKQEKSLALKPVVKEQTNKYAQIISSELNEFLKGQNVFVNATIYSLKDLKSSPLMMIKLSHENAKKDISFSNERIDEELKKLDQYLWKKKAKNIYFRKKLNYKKGDDIYIIRPNQRRFWSQSMAFEDASELILEILNGVHDEA